MKQYKELVENILIHGDDRGDRTGTGTRSIFGAFVSHDCREGFPLMTHKRMGTKSIFAELVWFLSGDTDVENLQRLGSTIWNEWTGKDNTIGPMYGAAWRGRGPHPVDQIAVVLRQLLHDKMSRRIIVSAWRPELLPDTSVSPSQNVDNGKMALAACHDKFQLYVTTSGQLKMMFSLRSADVGLGTPYNIASYAALLYILAFLTDLNPSMIIATIGDAHLYTNHIESGAIDEVLSRDIHKLPDFELDGIPLLENAKSILATYDKDEPLSSYSALLDSVFLDHSQEMVEELAFSVKNYTHEKAIKMDVSV